MQAWSQAYWYGSVTTLSGETTHTILGCMYMKYCLDVFLPIQTNTSRVSSAKILSNNGQAVLAAYRDNLRLKGSPHSSSALLPAKKMTSLPQVPQRWQGPLTLPCYSSLLWEVRIGRRPKPPQPSVECPRLQILAVPCILCHTCELGCSTGCLGMPLRPAQERPNPLPATANGPDPYTTSARMLAAATS